MFHLAPPSFPTFMPAILSLHQWISSQPCGFCPFPSFLQLFPLLLSLIWSYMACRIPLKIHQEALGDVLFSRVFCTIESHYLCLFICLQLCCRFRWRSNYLYKCIHTLAWSLALQKCQCIYVEFWDRHIVQWSSHGLGCLHSLLKYLVWVPVAQLSAIPASCWCIWEVASDAPSTWVLVIHLGDLDGVLGSWIWKGPTLAIVCIWWVNH